MKLFEFTGPPKDKEMQRGWEEEEEQREWGGGAREGNMIKIYCIYISMCHNETHHLCIIICTTKAQINNQIMLSILKQRKSRHTNISVAISPLK